MEKIPAACAMEWSIELEKGLRSKKPSCRIETIKKIGHKLHQWSLESSINMSISDMYGMVPGEDILFANTIYLRLADAFCSGDMELRKCILKVFLVELQHINICGKMYNGILASKSVLNYLELLKRLKIVYDTGDFEAKSLTLGLFGCLAGLAKDSSHICFLILSSLRSSHDLEVKASLYAAGCFSRLSEDFACIVLKILISIISSIERSLDVRLAAVRALAKLQCSSAIASKAYQAGRKLLLKLQMDDVKVEVLLSLSKLASETSLLFNEQLDLLQSFLSLEYPISLKAGALRCLNILLDEGSYHVIVCKSVFSALINIFDDGELPFNLQCLSLQILRKIFLNRPLNLPISDEPDLLKVVLVSKNVDTIKSKRGLALSLLVDLVCSIKAGGEGHSLYFASLLSNIAQRHGNSLSISLTSSVEVNPTLLISNASLFIMDQISCLVKEMICSCHKELICVKILKFGSESFVLNNDLKNMLNLILRLAQAHPSSSLAALHSIRFIVHSLVSWQNDGITSEAILQNENDGENVDIALVPLVPDGDQITIFSALVLFLCRFASACINIIHETFSITREVLPILEDLINCVKLCEYSCYDSFEMFCLIMHSLMISHCFNDEGDGVKGCNEIFCHYSISWFPQECCALDLIKKMVEREKFWEVYRAGKYSCSLGLWFAATFSFRKLVNVTKSGYYSNWIKALMLYVGGESEIKLLLFPKLGLQLVNSFQFAAESDQPLNYCGEETDSCFGEGFDCNSFIGSLSRVCSKICSSEKVLEDSADFSDSFLFQRWFLNFRHRFLENVVETLRLLGPNAFTGDKFNSSFLPVNSAKLIHEMHELVCCLTMVSFQFYDLAKSYDLLATSFMDIDAASFRGISRLGVTCSTLAFCTSIAMNVVNSTAFRNIMPSSADNLESFSNLKIVQDLAERMWDIECSTAKKLVHLHLVKDKIKHEVRSIMNLHGSNLFDNVSLSHILFAINGILCVQADLEAAKDVEDLIAVFLHSLQHLCFSIRKLMGISIVTPKYFFKVRPCIGSELFIFHANSEHKDELCVRPGFQLPLNLCIQLKNTSVIKCARISKIYCIVSVSATDCFTIENGRRVAPAQSAIQTHKADMLRLSEVLLLFLRTNNKVMNKEHHNVVDSGSLLTTFVCFELNNMGLGFSSCLLNVSHLLEGSYTIKWHSCCVDDRGFYWNLVPLSNGCIFTVKN